MYYFGAFPSNVGCRFLRENNVGGGGEGGGEEEEEKKSEIRLQTNISFPKEGKTRVGS